MIKCEFQTGIYRRSFKSFGKDSNIGIPSLIHNPQYICVGDYTKFDKYIVLTCFNQHRTDHEKQIFEPSITIGNNVSIGSEAHITCINRISIGNDVLFGKKVTITDNAHGTSSIEDISSAPLNRRLLSKGQVIIEDNVWIGDKVTILPNVTIGKGSIIGANSVITKDIPPNSVAAGIPAVILKKII